MIIIVIIIVIIITIIPWSPTSGLKADTPT
jgi:hypothetical protein